MVRNIIKVNSEDVPLILKVLTTGKSARRRFMENPEVRIESLKVALRPIKLQIGVCQSGTTHNLTL
jgi:hypothetical protein